jgi:hypothetical protein
MTELENTSGRGALAVVPPEVDRWNWGAFLLNWIWGLFNQVYIALLMFVPFVNLVMVFVLGAKGSAWAWRNKRWESVEEFKRVQRAWAIAGVIVVVAVALFSAFFVAMFFMVSGMLKQSDAYRTGVQTLQANAQVMEILGPPITTGFPSGNVQTSGPSGEAQLAIPVQGKKASGTLYIEATKTMGVWKADRLELQIDGGERIDLIRGGTPI